MSSNSFTKENLDNYLKELAKEFRKINGKSMPAEIVLVGGAAILTNYGFRDMTTDIDAVIHAGSAMKDAINLVGDKFNLPTGWLNADFVKTGSYSPKLNEFSVYYKTFYGVLSVRTISAEYLIAMKLRSGRKYKNDLSDVIGILAEHEKKGEPITFEKIEMAVTNLRRCDSVCYKFLIISIVCIGFLSAILRFAISSEVIGYMLMGILVLVSIIRTILFCYMDAKGE